jgi:hypothetical protein
VNPPTTQSELRSFLGLCNVYRHFVAGFAKIAAPLNILLRKGASPQLNSLSEEQLAAFETLRTRLLGPSIIALHLAEGLFTLDADASQKKLGVVSSKSRMGGHDIRSDIGVKSDERGAKLLHDEEGVFGDCLGRAEFATLPRGKTLRHPDGSQFPT